MKKSSKKSTTASVLAEMVIRIANEAGMGPVVNKAALTKAISADLTANGNATLAQAALSNFLLGDPDSAASKKLRKAWRHLDRFIENNLV